MARSWVVLVVLLALGCAGAKTLEGDAAVDTRDDGVCALSATYTFYDDGGLRVSIDYMTLSPPRTATLKRVFPGSDHADAVCPRALACDSATEVTVPEIEAAVANADVQAALAKPKGMLYGTDPRPADGTVWVFERNDDQGFMVGGGGVPAGLTALETLMRRLNADALASDCASFAP